MSASGLWVRFDPKRMGRPAFTLMCLSCKTHAAAWCIAFSVPASSPREALAHSCKSAVMTAQDATLCPHVNGES
jgi:hypothetical protein